MHAGALSNTMLKKLIYRKISLCIALIFMIISLHRGESANNTPVSHENGIKDDGRLEIIISAIMTHKSIREIGIYWNIKNLEEGDIIGLYDSEPRQVNAKAIFIFQPNNTRGIMNTNIHADFVATSELQFEDQCLKYRVAWLRNGMIIKTKCLSTHPNWMNERKTSLGSKRLNEIFIPGTHDSGAYYKDENHKFETVVDKYTITQDEDVLSQLIYGVRYLDIRVGRYPALRQLWWINHGYFSLHPLQDIIEDVKTFLNNTKEIVIFDVQEFPVGFNGNSGRREEEHHAELVAYLEDKFAGYYLPKHQSQGWAMTLNDIWATGKRLIIGYDNDKVYPKYQLTWPPVIHRWPNVKTRNNLYKKIERFEEQNIHESLDDFHKSSTRAPSSVMAQLTPQALDVLFDRLGGLRKMAQLVNINITDSYNERWRCSANIVSMDYIKSSGIIEAALEWNDKRSAIC